MNLDEVSNGTVERMVSGVVSVAWLRISRNLSCLASSNGFPFSLNVSSIEVVGHAAVVIAWLRIS